MLRGFFSLLLFVAAFAFATPTFAFTVRPAILELQGKPGQTIETMLMLQNEEGETRDFFVSIQKFIPLGEQGQQQFLPPEETSGLPSWTYVDRPVVRLLPGEKTSYHVAIRLPNDASAGGHYAAIFFSTQRPGARGEQQVGLGARTGVLLLVTVDGSAKADIRVKDFTLVQDATKKSFDVLLENAGTLHATPRAELRVKNIFGSTIAVLDANREHGRILPGSLRRLVTGWEPGFLFGPYTAELHVAFSDTEAPVIATLHFSEWPMRGWYIFIGTVASLIVLSILFRRWVIYRASV
jgi:hypothetical protein